MEPGGAGSTGIYVTTNRLSLLVVARDEERQLEDCLTSGTFADEIIVVLDRSTDASATIAARLGAKIIDGSWVDEGERRMTGISQCGGDWILELDADERISAELAAEVATQIQSDDADYYVIPFRNYIGGRWVAHGWGAYNGIGAKAALFRRGMKQWQSGLVHPTIVLDGKRGRLHGHIDHFVDEDITAMYARLNRYSAAAAADALAKNDIPHCFSTARRFFSRFLKSYVQRRGYKEGWHGMALAMFSALYPVLTHIKILESMDAAHETKNDTK
jgi:glycosyltransferase involved in cell wall biosynthesis